MRTPHRTGRWTITLGTALLVGFASLLSACSDDAGPVTPACPSTACEPDSVQCYGNAKWTCHADGLGWEKVGCGAVKACVEQEEEQEDPCVPRVCLNPGKSECDADMAGGMACAADGMSEAPFACDDGSSCHSGACVPDDCEHGEMRCGYRALLRCQEGAWAETDCGASKLCVEDVDGAHCEDWSCTPNVASCDNGNALVCDVEGREESVTACTDTEVCESGYCIAATCAQIEAGEAGAGSLTVEDGSSGGGSDGGGSGVEDAGPEEVGPHPGLEPISRIDFKLNGIPNTFDLAAMADYSEAESRLVISGSDGSRKLEINLAAVEPFSVGAWSDSDDSEIVVAVCYHDGTANETPPDGAGCSVGFSHAVSLYTLEISTNNGDGSRVTGTFSTLLIDTLGTQLDFTEGTFDVLHK